MLNDNQIQTLFGKVLFTKYDNILQIKAVKMTLSYKKQMFVINKSKPY